MIKYRLATLNDFDAVQAIENECFKEPYSTEDLHYEFEGNPVNKIIVAEKDGKVVGFIDFLITFNSSTIMQVAVTKDCRGNGIATHLLSEMVFNYLFKMMVLTILGARIEYRPSGPNSNVCSSTPLLTQ